MLDEINEKCLKAIGTPEDVATYEKVKSRLKYVMPSDKGHAYRTLQKLSEQTSFPELMLALAELAIVDGRIRFGNQIISCLNQMQEPDTAKS